ncbi:Uncharacterised protein [Bacillus licheniformis]|nr:Uncharacterised protein [Bacillus licheniformis]
MVQGLTCIIYIVMRVVIGKGQDDVMVLGAIGIDSRYLKKFMKIYVRLRLIMG